MACLTLSICVAYGIALAAWSTVGNRGRVGRALSLCAAIAVLFVPLLIPADCIGRRALVAVLCADLMFKLLDCSRRQQRRNGDGLPLGEYARFLIPFPVFLVVFHQRGRRLPAAESRWPGALEAMVGAALFAAAVGLVHLLSHLAVLRVYFALDHVVMVAIFAVAIEALSRALHGLERLVGYDTTPIVRSAYRARTVAEFWRRFNTRVHAWYVFNVFRPLGLRRAPVSGVLLSFFVSAILHELMFGIATSRFTGYQFTFFMLQAPAVLVSHRLETLATCGGRGGKALAHGITAVWFTVTSVLFFQGVNLVFPFFYASDP